MIALAAVLGVGLALVPTPALAHTIGGSGGVEIELLVVGAGVIAFGFGLRSSGSARRWMPYAVMALGAVTLGASLVVPRLTRDAGQSFAEVSIVRPEPGARVAAGRPVPIEVEVANAPVADSPSSRSGGHLHLFVDGRLEQMPYGTDLEVELAPGTHEITVEYVDFEHVSFEPRVEASVQVTARRGASDA